VHPLSAVRRTGAAGIVAAVLALASAAGAATFTVNSTDDTTDGVCAASAGGCTLREAIESAVADAGSDTIAFDPAVFPPGAPASIVIFAPLPLIADAAGTVLDGAGAGVVIRPPLLGGGMGADDGLVFASTAGAPLATATIANVTIRDFVGSGVVVCGGAFPTCDQDVAAVVVRNVVALGNGKSGLRVAGHALRNVAVSDSVFAGNLEHGLSCAATQSLSGTRVQGCTARDNGMAGIRLDGGVDVLGALIGDTVLSHNTDAGLAVVSTNLVSKVKVTNVVARDNQANGVDLGAATVDSSMLSKIVASHNADAGVSLGGSGISASNLKDVVVNVNGGPGIVLSAGGQVTGTSITNAKASGNTQEGIVIGGDNGVSGSKISRAILTGNLTDGLRLQGSKNVVHKVRADGNHGDGIFLDAPGSGNKIESCATNANDGNAGIEVGVGSILNVVQKNVSLANDGRDLLENNSNCDGSMWKKNVFQTHNAPCVH